MQWSKYDKKYQIEGHFKSVKFQLLIHCFIHNIKLSDAELDLLTLISIEGVGANLRTDAVKRGFFKTTNAVNNALTKYSKNKLLVKKNKTREINPDLQLTTNPLIVGAIRVINLEV